MDQSGRGPLHGDDAGALPGPASVPPPAASAPTWSRLGWTLYQALDAAIAAQPVGINVVVKGHHDAHYHARWGFCLRCSAQSGWVARFRGRASPVEVIMQRRRATGWNADLPPDAPPLTPAGAGRAPSTILASTIRGGHVRA